MNTSGIMGFHYQVCRQQLQQQMNDANCERLTNGQPPCPQSYGKELRGEDTLLKRVANPRKVKRQL